MSDLPVPDPRTEVAVPAEASVVEFSTHYVPSLGDVLAACGRTLNDRITTFTTDPNNVDCTACRSALIGGITPGRPQPR